MADLKRLLVDKYYLRSMMISVASKIKKNKTVVIDKNFKVYDKKDFNNNVDDISVFFDIGRFGDDFDLNEMCYYESDILEIINYIVTKYDGLTTLTELCFSHNDFSRHYGFETSTKKLKYFEPYFYTNIFGLVIDEHVIEFTTMKTNLNRAYSSDKIIVTYDSNVELDLTENEFQKLCGDKFDDYYTKR